MDKKNIEVCAEKCEKYDLRHYKKKNVNKNVM